MPLRILSIRGGGWTTTADGEIIAFWTNGTAEGNVAEDVLADAVASVRAIDGRNAGLRRDLDKRAVAISRAGWDRKVREERK